LSYVIFYSLWWLSWFSWQNVAAEKEATYQTVISGSVEVIASKVSWSPTLLSRFWISVSQISMDISSVVVVAIPSFIAFETGITRRLPVVGQKLRTHWNTWLPLFFCGVRISQSVVSIFNLSPYIIKPGIAW
jgi:hypothetical protein